MLAQDRRSAPNQGGNGARGRTGRQWLQPRLLNQPSSRLGPLNGTGPCASRNCGPASRRPIYFAPAAPAVPATQPRTSRAPLWFPDPGTRGPGQPPHQCSPWSCNSSLAGLGLNCLEKHGISGWVIFPPPLLSFTSWKDITTFRGHDEQLGLPSAMIAVL